MGNNIPAMHIILRFFQNDLILEFRLSFLYLIMVPFLLIFNLSCRNTIPQPDEYYCSLMALEPSRTSVLLQARLQRSDTLVDHDIQGIGGFVKFRITRETGSKTFLESTFLKVNAERDFRVLCDFSGLRPGQLYYYKALYGNDTSNVTSTPWNSFRTLEQPGSMKNVSFSVVAGINTIYPENFTEFRNNREHQLRVFPVFSSILSLNPDFAICPEIEGFSSEQINSDSGKKEILRHSHQVFSIPEFEHFISRTPFFWMPNKNSAFLSGINPDVNEKSIPGDRVNAMDDTPTGIFHNGYKTFRLNQDVQVWMLSKSEITGNEELINQCSLGENQTDWLKITLLESDAPFKILVSPFSFLPEGNGQATVKGLMAALRESERDSLFQWFIKHGLRYKGLYLINGSSPGMYHSIHPYGFEEFAPGPVDGNFRYEPSEETDTLQIDGKEIKRLFTRKDPGAGFIHIDSGRDEYNSPVLMIRYFDDQKRLLYAINKY